jgi:tetratricopeptide (TPR) repeat protein
MFSKRYAFAEWKQAALNWQSLMRLIVAMVLAVVPAWAEWSAHYRSGEGLLAQGRTEDAIRELKIALDEHPDGLVILDALGRAEMRSGRYRSAKRYFEKASHASMDNAVSMANWAQACFAIGEYRSAEQLLRRTLDRMPESADGWHLLGQIFYKSHRYSDAESAFHKALSISKNALILSDLAALYVAQHQDEQAIQMLQRAILEGSPGQGRARVKANLAELQWKHGAYDAARSGFQEALDEMTTAFGSKHPEVAVILERYSQVLRESGRKAEAKQAADRAAEIWSTFDIETNRKGFTVDWRDAGGSGHSR